jgi:lipoprotein-releasing system permease protein
MGISFFVSLKYFWSKSKLNIVNFISAVASLVLVIASCSFFIVLSVFSGLKEFGLQYNRAFDPDLKISIESGGSFKLSKAQADFLNSNGVVYSSVLEEKIVLGEGEKSAYGELIGVQQNYGEIVQTDSLLSLGRWVGLNSSEAVVSYNTASSLDLGLFEYGNGLLISVPLKKARQGLNKTLFKSRRFMATGVFNSSDEKDQRMVFTPLSSVQDLLDKKEGDISSVLIKTYDPAGLKKLLSKEFASEFTIKSREELNETYYKMINSEGLILNVLMGLILTVAMFNSVGAIIILIVEKQKSIKTLIKLGATPFDIKHIFFGHGLLISFVGGLLGLSLGVVFVWAQKTFSLIKLSGTTIAYPISFEASNILTVFLFLLTICGVGSYVASKRSLKIKLQ